MNDRKMLEGPAFHEVGHILAIYLTTGGLDCIDYASIDYIEEWHPSDYEYSGSTKLEYMPNTVVNEIKDGTYIRPDTV